MSRYLNLKYFLSSLLAIGVIACGNNIATTSSNSNPQPSISPAIAPAKPIKVNPPKSPSPTSDTYQQALVKAESAASITQSATSVEDWQIVSRKWQQAIDLVKVVPASSPNYKNAQAKLAEYQQQFNYAQQQANPGSKAVSAASKCLGKPDRKVAASGKSFTVPIKRREASTVVIDVTFFSSGIKQTYEMIFDTGASATVITPEMATGLRVKPIGATKVNTASGQGVVFGVGCMDSIQAGGVVVKNTPVIIGISMDLGLLGQDFFGDYDVTIRKNVVEFRHR